MRRTQLCSVVSARGTCLELNENSCMQWLVKDHYSALLPGCMTGLDVVTARLMQRHKAHWQRSLAIVLGLQHILACVHWWPKSFL